MTEPLARPHQTSHPDKKQIPRPLARDRDDTVAASFRKP